MKTSLIPMLACPRCQGSLVLDDRIVREEEVMSGTLKCADCDRSFGIENGVPYLLDCLEADITQERFTEQWQLRFAGKFEHKAVFGLSPEKRAKWILAHCTDTVQPGEWLLDAGCGSAETTYAVADQNPEAQVVGLDYSDAIHHAAFEAKNVPNLHLVRGDITHPPFQPSLFRKVYAIGVLHHTPDTAGAFKATAPLVAPGGRLLVWIYPDPLENPLFLHYYGIRDIGFLGQGHRLPAHWRFGLTSLLALSLLPSTALGYALLQKAEAIFFKHEPYLEAMSLADLHNTLTFFLFDNISPAYQFRHKKRQVMGWFKANGFSEVKTNHFGMYSGKRR